MNHIGKRRPQTWVSSYRVCFTVPGHVCPQKGRWQSCWCLAGEKGEHQLLPQLLLQTLAARGPKEQQLGQWHL